MVHWLQFNGRKYRNQELKLKELQRYLKENPQAKATGYRKITGDMFAEFCKLECDSNYNDLDIVCNSFFNNSLRHFDRKPCDLEYSEYVTEKINAGKEKPWI